MAEIKPAIETFAKIKVIGVGGSGGSAVNRMINAQIKGVEFIAANTDVQALHHSQASLKIHLGKSITRGLGAGMNPDVGAAAAEESQDEIREALKGSDMVFITCGLGGGTGSGSAPVIAEIARDIGALTVAVVTKPFSFEGPQRSKIAERAYEKLAGSVDTIIAIPNDRVLHIIDKKTSLTAAFDTVDDVLRQGVQGISELITVPGLINVDFADVRSIMADTGSSLMGIGRCAGDNRTVDAAKQAVASPLLELSVDGARGILFTVTGGSDLSMMEVSEAASVITQNADDNARVIFGAIIDESMGDEVKVCVIATGFEGEARKAVKQSRETNVYSGNRFLNSNTSAEKQEVAKKTQPQPIPRQRVRPKPEQQPVSVEAEDADDDDEDDGDDGQPMSFVKKAVATVKEARRERQPAVATGGDEDDLEVPAFLRRSVE